MEKLGRSTGEGFDQPAEQLLKFDVTLQVAPRKKLLGR
jgi:hypothetical protein